ncbi:hypothetical protein HMPREF1550_00516 [Actinomyces sp. oral taxon 877 str. F0543]|nr:hypothetical protein HMPREF1550_00516 [Actinomyces sp. oral taxon 877 str. F0543]
MGGAPAACTTSPPASKRCWRRCYGWSSLQCGAELGLDQFTPMNM